MGKSLEWEKPFELGRFVFAPGKSVYGFFFSLGPGALSEEGVLFDLLGVMARRGLSILHFSLSRPQEGKDTLGIVFVDMSGRESEVDDVVAALGKVRGVKEVRATDPLFDGFAVDEFMFPPKMLGERAIIVRKPAYEAMLKGLRERFGSAYEAILYNIGLGLGRAYFESHVKLIGRDLERLVKVAEALFKTAGFGVLKIIEINEMEKSAEIRIYESFECSLFTGSDRPMGHFVRGMLTGWLEGLFGTKLTSVEAACISMNDRYCDFIFKERRDKFSPLS